MRKTGAILVAAVLVLTACGREGERAARSKPKRVRATPTAVATPRPARTNPPPIVHAASLERFDACPELLGHLKGEARKRVGPYGLSDSGSHQVFGVATAGTTLQGGREMAATSGVSAGQRSADTAAAAAPVERAPSFSHTNVQEARVDEPDIVKTDGRHIFALRPESTNLARERLAAIAVNAGPPRLVGGVLLSDGSTHELLLSGRYVLAIARGNIALPSRAGAEVARERFTQSTVVQVVDVSDPTNMRVTHKLVLEGTYASARMVGGIARIVLNASSARLPFEAPQQPGPEAAKKTVELNKLLIDRTVVEDWLPRFKLQDASGTVADEGPVTTCGSTYHPKTFSGFGTTSVVTLDPADPDPQKSAAVLGATDTVYASTDNLYVATQRWPTKAAPRTKTALHRFDISDPRRAVYAASGEVEGTVLNQWSLSEHDGFFRIATTVDPLAADVTGAAVPASSSSVTILDARAPKLERVGHVGNLGRGERIYGVRYMGDVAYVVTFRRIDPLHVVDLSDPKSPRVVGKLKIPGYSAYLHPLGDGFLLGVGQDATTRGGVLGTQLSLFDVRDAAKPKRIDKLTFKQTESPVENDHHAFMWWGPSRLAVIPIIGYRGGSAAVGIGVGDTELLEKGRVSHREHAAVHHAAFVQRSLVVGDTLYTLSDAGLLASDLDSFSERGWVALR